MPYNKRQKLRASYNRSSGYHGVEKKMHSITEAETQIDGALGLKKSLIDGIAQGNNYDKRVGSKVFIHSIDIKGRLCGDNVTLGTEESKECDAVRIVLLIDQQSNGTSPEFAEVFNTTLANTPVDAYRNLQNTQRFQILYDKRHTVMPGNSSAAAFQTPGMKLIHIHKELKGVTVQYNDIALQSGLNAQIRTNNLWLYCIADSTTTSENPKWQFNARLRYTD